jgi:DDE family transposase
VVRQVLHRLFFGLKLHLSADIEGPVLALRRTPGNSDDRSVFKKMNEKLRGIFVADAGYLSKQLARDFFIAGERMLITSVRANMQRLATDWPIKLLNLRMKIEVHFRVLKLRFGLVTSFPRSIDGCLTHYLAAIAAHPLA